MGMNIDPWGIVYANPDASYGQGEMWQHHLDLIINRIVLNSPGVFGDNILNISSGSGEIIKGMNVEGNGIPMDTIVTAIGPTTVITLNNPVYIEENEEVTFTTARNSFYDNANHYSMLKVMFNGDQGSVKRFKTLNYEGTQTRVEPKDVNNNYQLHGASGTVNTGQIYYDNFSKLGWYIENLETDLQKGKLSEFIDKENKWFDHIRGYEDAELGDNLDTGEFSLQGLGNARSISVGPITPTWDCKFNNSTGEFFCDDPGDESGTFLSLTTCQNTCVTPDPVAWDCIENVCCPTTTCNGPGIYPDLATCQANCTPILYVKYMCDGGDCVVCDDGMGGGGGCGANQTWGNDPTCGGVCGRGPTTPESNPCAGFTYGSSNNPFTLQFCATDTTSPTNADGYVNLTITGGSGQFIFAWSTGTTTQNISGLTIGPVGVTVEDTCTGQTAIGNAFIMANVGEDNLGVPQPCTTTTSTI